MEYPLPPSIKPMLFWYITLMRSQSLTKDVFLEHMTISLHYFEDQNVSCEIHVSQVTLNPVQEYQSEYRKDIYVAKGSRFYRKQKAHLTFVLQRS